MRRLTENLVTMAAMVTDFEEPLINRRASGNSCSGEGELSPEDKQRSRLKPLAPCAKVVSMKAIVPCLVLGSSVLSAATILVVSMLLLA